MLVLFALLISGCTVTRPPVYTEPRFEGPKKQTERVQESERATIDEPVRTAPEAPSTRRALRERDEVLRDEVARWEGTPYRWGGTDENGVDCSGFVRAVYRDLFDLDLPRTTADQVGTGERVSRDDLQVGDLVFFSLSSKLRHVGIYLSDGEFAHASSSEGVTISHMDEPYWEKGYWTARRVLDEMADGSYPLATEEEEPDIRDETTEESDQWDSREEPSETRDEPVVTEKPRDPVKGKSRPGW